MLLEAPLRGEPVVCGRRGRRAASGRGPPAGAPARGASEQAEAGAAPAKNVRQNLHKITIGNG